MTLTREQQGVEDFLSAIAPWSAGYRPSFRYLAVRDRDDFVIVQGALYLDTAANPPAKRLLQTENLRVGLYPLSDLGRDLRSVIGQLTSGTLKTPDGDLILRPRSDGVISASFLNFNPSDPRSQNQFHLLRIMGSDQALGLLRQPSSDWELRAAATPYDGVVEALFDHQLGGLRTDASAVDVVAFNLAAVDFASPVRGRKAEPTVRLALGLDPSKVAIGCRVLSQGKVVDRVTIEGRGISWETTAEFQIGRASIKVPEAAVIQAIVSYGGVAQHYGWIADPSTSQNPRRAAYQVIDPNLDLLRELVTKTGKGINAREMEAGVAWLLWMLGFSPVQLGGIPRTQDAADLIAATPAGHFAVIECTTGTLKADNKLPLLVQRTSAVRESLNAANNSHLRVIPIIVTSMTRQDVRADLDQAEKLGVLVIAREELLDGINRTLVLPDADRMFADAERDVEAAQERQAAATGAAPGAAT